MRALFLFVATTLSAAHWAFEPVRRPELPAVRDEAWIRNPIDRFVLARLEGARRKPSPEASRRALLRRVYLDLTGLPPTPEEQAAFLADTRSGAYERAVEGLLRSPHHGEKWGRHWLDLARYADSDGFRSDRFRPHAWRYRRWVIDALNRDMPFDRFTIEQIAGDLLPGATLEQRIATGFQRNTLTNREGGIDPEQFRVEQVIDRTNTLGTVWLGLTVGCAQCHDHKYDPIPQRDYYRLFAYFNTAEEASIEAPLPGELGPHLEARPAHDRERARLLAEYHVNELRPEWERRMIEAAANPGKWLDWDHAFDDLRTDLEDGEKILRTDPAKRTRRQWKLIDDYFVANYHRVISKERKAELRHDELRKKLAALDAALPPLTEAPVLADERPDRVTRIFERGDYRNQAARVEPGTLSALGVSAGGTRLDLARWIASPENPLTARVAVNRIWQEYFGRGLVKSADNFGTQGERPSHPELLDWLASEFVNQRWSMKAMHRLIVTSAAYRQASAGSGDDASLGRQARFRLPAELIRDSALAASGLLDRDIGGKSVRPESGPGRFRRGMYIELRRTAPHTMLANFDAPNGYRPVCARTRSNTPLQALQTLNDPVFAEAARALAARIVAEGGSTFQDRLAYAFRAALARDPDAKEQESLLAFFERQKHVDAKTAEELFPAEPSAGKAAWVAVASVLLNLDEFLTRE